MNNRKPKNSRGKQTRKEYAQFIPEREFITVKREKIPNPAYPGFRRVVHQIVPPPDPRFKAA